MKNLAFILLLITTNLSICMNACKRCDNCSSGAECIKGNCICESGYYSFNNNCVQLTEDSYIGINGACYCYDTLIMSISGTGEYRSMTMPVKFGNEVGSLSQGIFYYEFADGDSLYSPQLDLRCFDVNNTPLKPAAYGKKQADGSWKIRLEFQDALTYDIVNNCTIILKKFNG